MVDAVLIVLGFYYVAQTIVLGYSRIKNRSAPPWILAFPAALFPAFFLGRSAFLLVALFILIWWSRSCRSADYGLSYHFFLVIAAAFVFGPVAGLVLGLIPILFAPFIRGDMQVIDVLFEAILLGIAGLVAGFFASVPGFWMNYALAALVTVSIIRFAWLFTKLSPAKVTFAIIVYLGTNYLLFTRYLPQLTQYLLGGSG